MRWQTLVKGVTVVVLTTVVIPLASGTTVLAAFLFLPLPASLPDPKFTVGTQISRVYDINGDEIGSYRRFEITQPVQPADIPQVLKNAVIAAEDKRFYRHGGVDLQGTLRALWADIRNAKTVQGGSTITQQYVKNAYVGSERSITRKVREAILASQLDRQMDKETILFHYLDQVYLGEGAYGVGAAAQTYFRKNVRDLSLSEAAMLAGMIPAPSFYDPRANPPGAENKRRIVLKDMLGQKMITQQQYDEVLPQQVWYSPTPPPKGATVTFVYPREQDRQTYPYFMDYVRRYIEQKYGDDAVYTRGLNIYTTLDPKMQQAAEEEVAKTLNGSPPTIEMALVSIEPGSGFVKAMVGGRDFYASGGQVNLALGGSTGKQPGSSFKPFVLAEALEQGVSPDKRYAGSSPMTIGGTVFKNFDDEQFGSIGLREALKRSVNTVFVQLLDDVGVQPTMDLARKLGDTRSIYKKGVHGLSVALGAVEASPIDMASAYGVWAARGLRAEPTPVVRILDGQRRLVEDNSKPVQTRVEREEIADTMNSILQGPLSPGGTAGGKDLGDRPAAGKTGTTDQNRNAWFVGYTPQLSTAVWMGHRDDEQPMGAVKGVRSVTGGTWPAATWQAFMKRALADQPVIDFNQPAPITQIADDAKRTARGGFDPGLQRPPGVDDGGTYRTEQPPLSVPPPSSTTTTTNTTLVGGF